MNKKLFGGLGIGVRLKSRNPKIPEEKDAITAEITTRNLEKTI